VAEYCASNFCHSHFHSQGGGAKGLFSRLLFFVSKKRKKKKEEKQLENAAANLDHFEKLDMFV
jgi:hypothetical protein